MTAAFKNQSDFVARGVYYRWAGKRSRRRIGVGAGSPTITD